MDTKQVDWLKHLASRGNALPPVEPPPTRADLQRFRDLIMSRPDDLRRRVLGANVQRRRRLSAESRRLLNLLDTSPDLLSPLNELRYEPSHTRLLSRFMNSSAEPLLGTRLLREFVALLFEDAKDVPVVDVRAIVEGERWLPTGRVDICITLPTHLIFVEVKIDADEGKDQLSRYSSALQTLKDSREGILVYLTLPEAPASSGAQHVHVTLDRLFKAWLPHADAGSGPEQFLSRYLKSIALLLERAGSGGFDDWTMTQQQHALDLIESCEV